MERRLSGDLSASLHPMVATREAVPSRNLSQVFASDSLGALSKTLAAAADRQGPLDWVEVAS